MLARVAKEPPAVRAHLRRHRRDGRAGGDAALRAVACRAWSPRTSAAGCRAGACGRGSIPQRSRARRPKGGFARGFRRPVEVSADLAREVDDLLAADALQFLALVNKAGLAVAGAAKVEAALRAGRVVALIHAREGAQDGIEKLDRLARGSGRTVATINLFESARLDLALGRTNVIHAALHAGPASAAFLAKVARLIAYRSGEAAGSNPVAAGLT